MKLFSSACVRAQWMKVRDLRKLWGKRLHQKSLETEDPDDMEKAEDEKEAEETDEANKSNHKYGEFFGKEKKHNVLRA